MIRHPQKQQTVAIRLGAIMVSIGLWLSLFCNVCLAFTDLDSGTDHKPTGHCHQAEIEKDSGHHSDGGCDSQCGSSLYSLQTYPLVELAANHFPNYKPVPGVSVADSGIAEPIPEPSPVHYDRPARSYFPPFQRYTVLLN